jgi:hypothetical protein
MNRTEAAVGNKLPDYEYLKGPTPGAGRFDAHAYAQKHQARIEALRPKDKAQEFRLRASLNKDPGDEPGAALRGGPAVALALPRWAEMALRRGEDVPGHVIPMADRWHHVCGCGRVVFFIAHNQYQPPALHEIIPEGSTSDLEDLGRYTLEAPLNLIQRHPCPWPEWQVSWDELEELTRNPSVNLMEYVK